MKIKKKDKVKILSGKDKGREAEVEKVFHKKGKVLLTGINVYKKHTRPSGQDRPGGIVELNRPLSVAKVALICPVCGKPTRVGYQLKKGQKKRICRACQGVIDQ